MATLGVWSGDRQIALGCPGLAGMGSVFGTNVSHGFTCERVASDTLHACHPPGSAGAKRLF